MNLKIARIERYLAQIQKSENLVRPLPEHIVHAMRHLTEFCMRHRMLLWFNFRHSGFIHELCTFVQSMTASFDDRQSAVIIWMLSKLGRLAFKAPHESNPTRSFLSMLVRQLLERKSCQQMTVHDTMLLINGLANLECRQMPYVLDACLPRFMEEMSEMSSSIFALLVWSYGKLGYLATNAAFNQKCFTECEKRETEMTVQQMASVAWGLCRMEHPDAADYLTKCIQTVHTSRGSYIPLGMARLIEACLIQNRYPGNAALRVLSNRFAHFRGCATPALCDQALPAFAYFVQFPQTLFTLSHEAMNARYRQLMEPEQRIRILAAYSLADTLTPCFFEDTIQALLTQGSYEDLPPDLLRELWISFITHRIQHGHRVENVVPRKLMSLMKEAWIDPRVAPSPHSLAQEIESVFKDMKVTCSSGYSEPGTAILADLVCQYGHNRVVLFIVDTADVFSNLGKRLNGRYLWKERQFLKLGYGVGRILAEKWELLGNNPSSRQAYLTYILQHYRCLRESDRPSRVVLSSIQDIHANVNESSHRLL